MLVLVCRILSIFLDGNWRDSCASNGTKTKIAKNKKPQSTSGIHNTTVCKQKCVESDGRGLARDRLSRLILNLTRRRDFTSTPCSTATAASDVVG